MSRDHAICQPDNSGPAFPFEDEKWPGMTLRDYFIAHAPADPQGWFKPVVDAPPTRPPQLTNVTHSEDREWSAWRDGCLDIGEMAEPRIRAWAESKVAYDKAVAAHANETYKQLHIQWPAAWADAMLEQRAIQHTKESSS